MVNEATQNKNKISYDEYYREKRVISDMLVQADIGSAQQVSSPKFMISAHQTKRRIGAPDKKLILLFLIMSIFENITLK